MFRLPVIVGFGGYNAAGRSSFHHGYRRTVIESLPSEARQETLASLAVMMKLVRWQDGCYRNPEGESLSLSAIEQRYGDAILNCTLVRRIESAYLDVDAVHWHKCLDVQATETPLTFIVSLKQLPEPLPSNWRIEPLDEQKVRVSIHGSCEMKVDSYRALTVKSAGQLPSNFAPGEHYNAHFHPRGIQLAIAGAADALHSIGIPWQSILDRIHPDEVGVFSGSLMTQLDDFGNGGLMKSRLYGHRVSAKQLPLGFNSMPTDFINAYVLGSVGTTGTMTGACATFLYNLKKAIEEIAEGRIRVAIVGNSEAPILSECIEGYSAMGALATEEGLRRVSGDENVDFRRASRPFGENCGFSLAESCQYIVLMDDALALELGADIHGAVTDVFINADGFKRSISAPGPGNYLTMGKAVASAVSLVGTEAVRSHSFVHAHGSSTPANRVTESEILDRVAQAFGIENWPITAVKAFVGHSLATASGDQLISALGTFRYGLLPGIKTIGKVADDVHRQRLTIPLQDLDLNTRSMDICFINSKGFGGNNASGVLLSPRLTERMLRHRYGEQTFNAYCRKREATREAALDYESRAMKGEFDYIYRFGENMIDDSQIEITTDGIHVPGFKHPILFAKENRYRDMLEPVEASSADDPVRLFSNRHH